MKRRNPVRCLDCGELDLSKFGRTRGYCQSRCRECLNRVSRANYRFYTNSAAVVSA